MRGFKYPVIRSPCGICQTSPIIYTEDNFFFRTVKFEAHGAIVHFTLQERVRETKTAFMSLSVWHVCAGVKLWSSTTICNSDMERVFGTGGRQERPRHSPSSRWTSSCLPRSASSSLRHHFTRKYASSGSNMCSNSNLCPGSSLPTSLTKRNIEKYKWRTKKCHLSSPNKIGAHDCSFPLNRCIRERASETLRDKLEILHPFLLETGLL